VEVNQLEQTMASFRDHRVTFVSVDTPRSDHFNVMPPLDVVTNPRIAYLRLHGRNEHGYISGKSVAERSTFEGAAPTRRVFPDLSSRRSIQH
jgi:uncharacterized protein YecE (DUF72 family)